MATKDASASVECASYDQIRLKHTVDQVFRTVIVDCHKVHPYGDQLETNTMCRMDSFRVPSIFAPKS